MITVPENRQGRRVRVPAWSSSISSGVEGTFRVSPKAKVGSVQVRDLRNRLDARPKATQSVTLG